MARGDSLYARVDVDMVRSLKFNSLPPAARALWLFLWCYALEQRTPVIDAKDLNQIRDVAGLKRVRVPLMVQLLHDEGYLMFNKGYITMTGIMEKHQQFQWSKSPNDPQTRPIRSPNVPLGTERNRTEPNGTPPNPPLNTRGVVYDAKFAEWFDTYPNQDDPTEGKAEWGRQLKAGATAEKLHRAKDVYIAECRNRGTSKDHIKKASTLLKAWRDWQEPPKRKGFAAQSTMERRREERDAALKERRRDVKDTHDV